MIEFYLNGCHHQLSDTSPNQTVLEWLRTSQRLSGTKEGCGGGDCGACTVAIGSPDSEGRLRYQSVNSCIALVGSLHGKHLVTVDGLQGSAPHPAQTALVECHGSQCGFCTPGFVMSLLALHSEKENADAPISGARLKEALGGNLCRCTGYRPILEAGRRALVETWEPSPAPQRAGQINGPAALQQAGMSEHLQSLQQQASSLQQQGLSYHAPTSLAQLYPLLAAQPQARLIAGGTDLALEITQQLRALPQLISLERVAELRQLDESEQWLEIGAGLTFSEFGPALSRHWPAFAPLLERLGSRQIRNRGTLGGNLGNASPIGDMAPPLIALGASVQLSSASGERWLPLEAFFTGYKQTQLQAGEVIARVRVPLPVAGQKLFIHKVSKRIEDDISAVLGAFWLQFADDGTLADCRLAYGGMAATPARAPNGEQILRGQPFSQANAAIAAAGLAADFSPLSDVRASAEYRLMVAGNLLVRSALEHTTVDAINGGTTSPILKVTDYA